MTRLLWDRPVVMADGVRLSVDVRLPGGEPAPTILVRTCYGKSSAVVDAAAERFLAAGYAVAVQDVRGRHDSGGEWVPFVHEAADGAATVEWVAAQPWCDGRVATWGGSYLGWTQWSLASRRPAALVAVASTATCARFAEELPFDRGIPVLAMTGWLHLVGGRVQQDPRSVDWATALRHLPVSDLGTAVGRELPAWREWLEHPGLDGYWRDLRLDDVLPGLEVPGLHITGWFDDDQAGALLCWDRRRDAAGQHLVIGPWDHGGTRVPQRELGGVDFGPSALVDVLALHTRFYDHVFHETEITLGCSIFLTGRNEWVGLETYPPAGEELELHLGDGGVLGPVGGGSTHYPYDPADPVPSGLDDNVYAAEVETPLDRSFQLDRADVVTWTSAAFDQELIVAGFPRVGLHASSDRPDTDWMLALHDQAPDGARMQLSTGRMRARFRHGLDHEVLLEAGTVEAYDIELSAVGHVLLTGHRLVLSVTSSDFPVFDRNPNTGAPIGTDVSWLVARNTVHHTSVLHLPVVAAAALLPPPELPLAESATEAPTV